MFGTLDLTTVFIYPIFFSSKLQVFFQPLKLNLTISSLPNIACLARQSARFLKLATLLPGLSAKTCSVGLSFGSVINGGSWSRPEIEVGLILVPLLALMVVVSLSLDGYMLLEVDCHNSKMSISSSVFMSQSWYSKGPSCWGFPCSWPLDCSCSWEYKMLRSHVIAVEPAQ